MSNAEVFTAAARAYAEIWAPVLLPHGRRLLDELPLSSARRVLEIAAGAGLLLPEIRARAPQARIVGTDIAGGLLRLAPPGFDLAVMDAAHLALADGAFDAVVIAFGIFIVPDGARALREARRVLRRGGAFAASSWEREPRFPAVDIWNEEVRAAGAPALTWWPEALEAEALSRACERAGFREVRARYERFDHRHDPAKFLRMRTALVASWLASLADEARRELLGRIERRLAALSADDFVDPTRILVVRGRAG